MSNSLVNYTIVIPPPPRPPLPKLTPAPLTTRWTPPTPPTRITTPHRGNGGGGYVNGGGRGNGVYHVGDCSSNPCQVELWKTYYKIRKIFTHIQESIV